MATPEMYAVGDHNTCVPQGMSIIRGLQAFSLGVRPEFVPGDKSQVGSAEIFKEAVERLEDRFDLIMILEHLPESLALL